MESKDFFYQKEWVYKLNQRWFSFSGIYYKIIVSMSCIFLDQAVTKCFRELKQLTWLTIIAIIQSLP